jgi:flagellar protein FliO/FliZ
MRPPFGKELPSLEELEKQGDGTSGHFMSQLMSMVSSLLLVLAILLVLAWVLRRMVHTRVEQANVTSVVKVIERRVISPKATLYLLDVFGKRLLIGETHAGLVRLADLPSSVEPVESPFEKLMQDKK